MQFYALTGILYPHETLYTQFELIILKLMLSISIFQKSTENVTFINGVQGGGG